MKAGRVLLLLLGVCPAIFASPVIVKLNEERRYDLVQEGGVTHVVDLWRTADDLRESARFNPDTQIGYHLYTRSNPISSQPMIPNLDALLPFTNYDARKRTIVLIHGWRGNLNADINKLLVPAILAAEDVNIIVVDWSAGGGSINYITVVANSYPAAEGMSRFFDWLMKTTNTPPFFFSCFGHSIGAHQCGIVSRLLGRQFYYINGMEPALAGFITSDEILNSNDALYVEVIHTNAGGTGYLSTLGQVDFYPNGGMSMPGCDTVSCSHSMSQFYFAESIVQGGFTGRKCLTYLLATQGRCTGAELNMGGMHPKPGARIPNVGIFCDPERITSSMTVGSLELLARYSMKSGRATSLLSSLHEFRNQEAEVGGFNKNWNWKYLRDQFHQKSLEMLYRKYDGKLREGYITIYLTILFIFSTIHIIVLVAETYTEMQQWHPTYLSLVMYIVRISTPFLLLWRRIYEPMRKKFFWFPVVSAFAVLVLLIFTDLVIVISGYILGEKLRPASSVMVLLSCYVFLPLRNNYISMIFGAGVSAVYILTQSYFTYFDTYPSSFTKVLSDVLFVLGVNLLGVYFRLMNEIVTRRSFLDHRACVETTLKLKFEKDQEERLMASILPEHIASRVKQDIRTTFLSLQSARPTYSSRTLNHLYVEEHENVSILYADVVNYTMISTTLPASRMVELLNELFGRFDEASEEHEVLRIKFLGDCYYCASGIPNPNPQHAKSCVDLGLDMISIIKDVREKRSLDIDMRIGVHSGKILSGLIGIRKWQYDIWSNDVTIANKMESSGKPGKVHITKQTLESLKDGARDYIIEPNFEAQNNEFIRQNKLETYLISKPIRTFADLRAFRRVSVGFNVATKRGSSRRRSDTRATTVGRRRTTAFMDNNLLAYQQMLKTADLQMEKEIESLKYGSDYVRQNRGMNALTLMFRNMALEKEYLLLPDPLFKYYISVCLVIVLFILAINGITTNGFEGLQWYFWLLYTILVLFLTCLQPLTWFQFLWTKYFGVEEPRNPLLRWMYDVSALIVRSAKIRAAIHVFITLNLSSYSLVNLIGCTQIISTSERTGSFCLSPWHVTQSWSLAILLNFLFSRALFLFKWFMASAMTCFYLWIVWERKGLLFMQDVSWNIGLDPRFSHSLAVVFITMTLYFIDRQTEYRNRLDFLWQEQLKKEQEEASTMLKVNNMLLLNILPAHVADIYLDFNRPADEIYCEKYDKVAVMFASLTGYKLGSDGDVELSDRTLVSILDQIISDFDRLLMHSGNAVYKVEKIKLAGWTYMAAVGLDPSRRDSIETSTSFQSINNGGYEPESSYEKAIVTTIVQFAATMMNQLRNFSRGSFQSFENVNLRIGISHGDVAAGVVGSLKPLYDIWGHAVNMASRMDSTGEPGKIQVTENTAIVLDDCGIETNYRGKTFVKGAGYIRTYYVPLDEDFNFLVKDRCIMRKSSNDNNKKSRDKKKERVKSRVASHIRNSKEDECTESEEFTTKF